MSAARRLAAVLLVSSYGCVGTLPAGPTHVYRSGSASVSVAAGVERSEFEVGDLQQGSYQENRALRFVLAGAGRGLDVEVYRVRGKAEYGGANVGVSLRFEGRTVSTNQGGACSALVRRADADGVDGSLSCVGLGTHTGKGYDLGARFVLTA